MAIKFAHVQAGDVLYERRKALRAERERGRPAIIETQIAVGSVEERGAWVFSANRGGEWMSRARIALCFRSPMKPRKPTQPKPRTRRPKRTTNSKAKAGRVVYIKEQ